MPPLHLLLKPASGLCNLRCAYCFYADEMAHRQQPERGMMAVSTLEAVLQKALQDAEDSCTVAFQGGEPTLAGLDFYRQVVALAAKHNQKGLQLSFALQTNGLLLDGEWCRFLAENHFLVGLSVDGLPAVHDAFRRDAAGGGSYHRAIAAAHRLREAGVEFNILTVVTARSAPRIADIYRQYQKQGFAWQQYIACLEPLDCPPGAQKWSLTPRAYGRFLVTLFDLWEADVRRGRAPYIRQFENWLGILLGQPPESCEQRGVCSLQYVVEADGSVYPCDFYVLDGYCLGNLVTDSFDDIRRRAAGCPLFTDGGGQSVACRACRYFPLCRGGCRRHRGAPGLPENIFCESYKMFFDACLPRLQRLAQGLAQGMAR